MTAAFEKYATAFALAAVTGQKESLRVVTQPFTKSANISQYLQDPTVQRYLVGGLGGLAAGTAIGALQPENKKRKALQYGVMGGMGGLSLAHLLGSLPPASARNDAPRPPSPAAQAATDVAQTAAHLPGPLLTPLRDLPAPEPVATGNSVVDAAINIPGQVAQNALKTDPALGAASGLYHAAAIPLGVFAGNRVGRGTRQLLTNAVDRSGARRLSQLDSLPALKPPKMKYVDNDLVAAIRANMPRQRANAELANLRANWAAQNEFNAAAHRGRLNARAINRADLVTSNLRRGRGARALGTLLQILMAGGGGYGAARAPGAIEDFNRAP